MGVHVEKSNVECRILHLFPHVALMCLSLFSKLSGEVITQQRTLTLLVRAIETSASPFKNNSLVIRTTSIILVLAKKEIKAFLSS